MVPALPKDVADPGGAGSISVTRSPRIAIQSAALVPTIPAPTTATSLSLTPVLAQSLALTRAISAAPDSFRSL